MARRRLGDLETDRCIDNSTMAQACDDIKNDIGQWSGRKVRKGTNRRNIR